jgi:hypothetical protein
VLEADGEREDLPEAAEGGNKNTGEAREPVAEVWAAKEVVDLELKFVAVSAESVLDEESYSSTVFLGDGMRGMAGRRMPTEKDIGAARTGIREVYS